MQLNKFGDFMRMRGFCSHSAQTDIAFFLHLSRAPQEAICSFENLSCSGTNEPRAQYYRAAREKKRAVYLDENFESVARATPRA